VARVRWNFVDFPATFRLRRPIILNADMAIVPPSAALALDMVFGPPHLPDHLPREPPL
jgi:hypothetical protein